ncbi:MAG: S8 family serine peptidase [Bacteroidetes bacterium]|nr:S8 family serine peptidase [Bacteroidota bacterium]
MTFKKITLLFSLISTTLFAQVTATDYISTSHHFKLSPGVNEKDYFANTIIFKVNEDYRSNCSLHAIENTSLTQALNYLGATGLVKKFPNHQLPAKKENKSGQKLIDLSLIYEFTYTTKVSVEKAANLLLKSGILDYAEPHYLPHFDYQPNDPQATVSGQYHLNKINAYAAWDISKGDTNIVIGITDTGTEPTHQDLFANIKHNYADPIDGLDNDSDGYVDNYTGWDVGMNDNDPSWEGNPHGVHVSGCAAASTDNLTGVAGSGFDCKFLPVKIADAGGALISAYEGIIYAADHGCGIINCSWGSSGGGQFGQNAVDYATINKDALVVCAAGNDNVSTPHYPSAFNNAFSVASTTTNDNKSSFSNFGYTIDVCAPGSNINATYPGNSYTQISGTSMASPVAAGAAAIVKAMFPQYTALQIGEQLKATCDPINAATLGVYAGKLGKGRINLFQGATNVNAKSVTMMNRNVTDGNDNAFVGNDTLQISGDFVNFLAPLTNLNVTLSSTSPYVTILNNTFPVGAMTTLQQVSNSATPFRVKISPTSPANVAVTFKLNFSDGAYSFNYYFIEVINVDYINVTVNDISTSITSKGRIGFNSDGQADGLGFKYKNGRQLLYEAGLMIGTSGNKVSDMVRGANAGTTDNDFSSIQRVSKTLLQFIQILI